MVLCARAGQGADQSAPALPSCSTAMSISPGQTCRTQAAKRMGRSSTWHRAGSCRPFNRRLAPLDGLRMRRIEKAMQTAAVTGGTFHLWWHPENFGKNLSENMAILTRLLDRFQRLRDEYGMQSRAMYEVGEPRGCRSKRHMRLSAGPRRSAMTWARKRAVDVHDETAGYFSAEYSSNNVYDSPFRYGRSLIDAAMDEGRRGAACRRQLPGYRFGHRCLYGAAYRSGLQCAGIEPSAEMRKLAGERVPDDLVSDGSVTDLPVGDRSQDFIYAIEVFRYLDAADNARGHREIFRALKPGGVFFGTYVNRWALDGYRQFVGMQKLRDRCAQDGAALSRGIRDRLVA